MIALQQADLTRVQVAQPGLDMVNTSSPVKSPPAMTSAVRTNRARGFVGSSVFLSVNTGMPCWRNTLSSTPRYWSWSRQSTAISP